MDGRHYLGEEIAYVNGELHVEGVALKTLAEAVSTPVYVYSLAMMQRRYREFTNAMHEIDPNGLVCFAVKSLSNQTVLTVFKDMDAGADLVTGGELERALAAGFDSSKLVFSGLGKTEGDIIKAIANGVQINIESVSELELVRKCSESGSKRARVAIRLNPQLEAMRGILGQITTGKPDSKFGIPWKKVKELLSDVQANFRGIDLIGASVHIGSNLDLDDNKNCSSLEKTFEFLKNEVVDTLSTKGVKFPILIDLGGGVGIDYDQTPRERSESETLKSENLWLAPYASLVRGAFGGLVAENKVRLVFEPGRFLSGEAGVLLTKVLHVKKETECELIGQDGKRQFSVRFLIVDAGMNDLMRPGLYGAYHHIVPVEYAEPDIDNVDICGAVCETTDSFMRPTREWLERYNNIFENKADDPKEQRKGDSRKLKGQRSIFGEVEPQYRDEAPESPESLRTYEYFVKRRFPSSIESGDLVAILNAGAYGAVMSSEYNSRPLVPEVLVNDVRYAVIRRRPKIEDIIMRDCAPEWKG